MKSRQQQCIEQWEPVFRVKSAFFKTRMQRRKYQDVYCIPVFILIVFALITFSAYLSYLGYELYRDTDFEINFLYNFDNLRSESTLVWISLGVIIIVNVLVVMTIIIFLGKYPENMIKILIVISIITLSSLSIYFFVYSQYALGAILLLLFIIYVLAMFCVFRDHYKTCLIIIKIVGHFLKLKPHTFLISLVVSFTAFVAVGILILSVAGLLQMIAFDTITNTFGELYLLTQIIEYIFIVYIVYYITTFMVSCSVSNWYFDNSSYTLFSGMGLALFNHLGSLTFAAIIITPIKIISTITDSAQKNTDNMCAQFSICLLKPCLSVFQGLVKTMNRYSVITIAFTGQSFVAGARSAAVIAFSNLKMLTLVEGVQMFYFLSICLLSVIWSVGLGFIIAQVLNIGEGVIFTIGILIMVNTLTSLIWTSIFTESIASTCFFFMLQQKVKTYGHRLFNIDKKVKQLYSELFIDNEGGNIQDSDDQVVYPKSKNHEPPISVRDQIDEINQTQKQHIIDLKQQ